MKIDLMPIAEEMIPSAGRLLSGRHKRNRAALPESPARFEDATVATRAIETLLGKKTAGGFGTLCDGRLVAYLIGETSTQSWGRCGYIYLPGYGLAEGESPEIIQDLYALLGEEWNRKGCFNHYAYISAADTDIIDAWFDLGFGKERVDALLSTTTKVI